MTGVLALSWPARVAALGASIAMGSFVALHLLMAHDVDPLRDPLSMYALKFPGNLLFPLGTLALMVSFLTLAINGLAAPYRGTIRWVLGTAAVMLFAVVAFRTDSGIGVSSISGEIHRYTAGAAYVLITAAGFWIAAAARFTALGKISGVLSVGCAAILLVIVITIFAPHLADSDQWRGVPQRLLLAVQSFMVLLWAVARAPKPLPPPATVTSILPRLAAKQQTAALRAPCFSTQPGADQELWLSGHGGDARSALPSGNGHRSTVVCR